MERLHDARQWIAFHKNACRNLVLDDNWGKNGQTDILAGEKSHHRHVLHFGHDLRPDTQPVRKRIEADAHAAVCRRQDDGVAAQSIRKACGMPQPIRRSHQADRALRKTVRDKRGQRIPRRRLIEQDDIQVERLESPHQFARAAGSKDEIDIRAAQKRAKELHLEVARKGCQRTDAQRLPGCPRLLKRAKHLVPRGEDRVGMVEDDLPGFCQMQLPAPALEQRMAEPLLEFADLHRQRRLREIQPLCGAGEISVVGDRPEVAKMIVVQGCHKFDNIEQFLVNNEFLSNLFHRYLASRPPLIQGIALSLHLLPLLAPLLLLVAAVPGFVRKGRRPPLVPIFAEGAAFGGLLIAIASLMVLILHGPGDGGLSGWGGIGLSVRLDAVSATMLLLVSFVGWIVVRFARTYLDGEARQGYFTGWLCAALAAVLLLVQAGNLVQLIGAWIATSFALHRLLLFYPERVAAQRAARKKRLFSTIGAIALIGAALLLSAEFGTSDIATINALARAGDTSWHLIAAAAMLALAAVLKSAQFPTHGWLTEVMEAPTPVSALLHAGVINAGGFLLIRFADVMLSAPGVLAVLAMLGGFTALFGALVMLTQPAVKTSLAWSTVAQMGFMMLQCGLALFPLALLHIVAHSLYKAHAFLASGGAVEQVAAIRRPGPVAVPDGSAVGRAFLIALAIYAGIGAAFGFAFGSSTNRPRRSHWAPS